jgi:excisionase family DNA binding protein
MSNRSELFRRKFIVRGAGGGHRVYADAQERTFGRLKADDFLDTADLCRFFGCSTRTIYRWIAEEGLRCDVKVGRDYLFRKDDIVEFYEAGLPQWGRPPKRRR